MLCLGKIAECACNQRCVDSGICDRSIRMLMPSITLSLGLIGPWVKGEDHSLPGYAKHILVATLEYRSMKMAKQSRCRKKRSERVRGVKKERRRMKKEKRFVMRKAKERREYDS